MFLKVFVVLSLMAGASLAIRLTDPTELVDHLSAQTISQNLQEDPKPDFCGCVALVCTPSMPMSCVTLICRERGRPLTRSRTFHVLRRDYECQTFEVACKTDNYEVRKYPKGKKYRKWQFW